MAVRTEIVWETTSLQETGREVFHPAMQEPTYFDLLRFNHMVPIGIVFRRSAYDEPRPHAMSAARWSTTGCST